MLNNQPMGFYHPATLVKDAQRHGLKVLPVDVTKSDWLCTLESVVGRRSLVVGQEQAVSHPPSGTSQRKFAVPNIVLNNRFIAGPGFSRANRTTCEEGFSPSGTHASDTTATDAVVQISWEEIGSYTRLRTNDHLSSSAAKQRQNEAHGRDPQHARFWRDGMESASRGVAEKNTEATEGQKKITAAPELALRLGLKYVRGLREAAAQALVRERSLAPFQSIHDLTHRVPELRKDELNTLAGIGALNSIGNSPQSTGPARERFPRSEITKVPTICNLKSKINPKIALCLCASVGKALFTRNRHFTAATLSGRSRKPFAAPDRCSKNSPNPTAPRPSIA